MKKIPNDGLHDDVPGLLVKAVGPDPIAGRETKWNLGQLGSVQERIAFGELSLFPPRVLLVQHSWLQRCRRGRAW